MEHRQNRGEESRPVGAAEAVEAEAFAGGAITPTELERERLRTYIDWAEVHAPVWYWPAYGIAIALWLAGYELGTLWGAAGALLVVAVAIVGLRVSFARAQVSMPRVRGMPSVLKQAYLPVVGAALWLVGVLLYIAVADAPPYVSLGVLTGLFMSLAGAWSTHRYRLAARRLAAEAGLAR